MLKCYWFLLLLLLLLPGVALAGCSPFREIPATATPTMRPTPYYYPTMPPKDPEPQIPVIGGQIFGLPEGVRPWLSVTQGGSQVLSGSMITSEPWEAIIPAFTGAHFMVSATAEGYEAAPAQYEIHVDDQLQAWLVEDGVETDIPATHLDFTFTPLNTATP